MRISTSGFANAGISNLLSQESSISRLEREVSSGQSLLSPADAPAQAGAVVALSDRIDSLGINQANAQVVKNNGQQAVSVLGHVNSLLDQLRVQAEQAANGTTNAQDREALSSEVHGSIQELVQLANTQLPDGRYMFGGSRTGTAPFVTDANGSVSFVGDGGVGTMEIAPGLTVPDAVSGQSVFMNVLDGNGSFAVGASGSNSGTGVAVMAGVTNASTLESSKLAGTEYEVSFQSSGSGLSYTVTSGTGTPGSAGFSATSGAVASGAFSSGMDLNFGGMEIRINGTPAPGDVFTARPSENQSVFSTVSKLVAALKSPANGPAGKALMEQGVQNALAAISSAQTNVLSAEASLGGSLTAVTQVGSQVQDLKTTYQEDQSSMQDANIAKVSANLASATTALKGAEKAFGLISGLSLFNYVK